MGNHQFLIGFLIYDECSTFWTSPLHLLHSLSHLRVIILCYLLHPLSQLQSIIPYCFLHLLFHLLLHHLLLPPCLLLQISYLLLYHLNCICLFIYLIDLLNEQYQTHEKHHHVHHFLVEHVIGIKLVPRSLHTKQN